MNVKLSSSLWALREKQKLRSQKTFLEGYAPNTYSPSRFYLTFSHENSWSFDKILNLIKNLILTLLYKYMTFPLFWLILSSFFCLNYAKPFLSTINKCAITIMIIAKIINVKSFLERHFWWISINNFWK